jgi:POT family proton-dependent oligopeptide transporter
MLKNIPRTVWILSIGKLWDTFSYYGTQTILALYVMHTFNINQHNSFILYGTYAALAFLSPVVGGVIADKWLGSQIALMVGCVLSIIGNLILFNLNYLSFCFGLAISLLGMGLFKSNSTHLIGQAYKNFDHKKETGFTLFYLFINLGGALGPLIYGIIAYNIGWRYIFIASAMGLFFSLIWMVKYRKLFKSNVIKTISFKLQIIYLFGTVGLILLISAVIYNPNITNFSLFLLFIIGFVYILKQIIQYSGSERRKLISILIFGFFAVFYFASGLQIGATIVAFINHETKLGYLTIKLPASSFGTLYCLFVLLFAPILTYIWSKLRKKGIAYLAPTKLALSIFLAISGMLVFAISAYFHIALLGTILGIMLLSLGELVMSPAAYTTISNLSPQGIKSTMMGCWLYFVALGGYLSSILANVSNYIMRNISPHQDDFFLQFMLIASFTAIILAVFLVIKPKLNNIMK